MTSAAADLRLVYGPNAAKKIAREFGVAVVTAKLWLAGRAPAARHEEFRQALLAECDRIEARLDEIRKEWSGDDVSESERHGAASGADPAVARGKVYRNRPLVR